eukprot:6937362-Lingulodinium_polyedra.AAC.1
MMRCPLLPAALRRRRTRRLRAPASARRLLAMRRPAPCVLQSCPRFRAQRDRCTPRRRQRPAMKGSSSADERTSAHLGRETRSLRSS